MMIKTMLKEMMVPAIIMIVLDYTYLGMMSSMYGIQIASVQKVAMTPRYLGAVICYMLLIFGLYYFILRPRRSLIDAFIFGVIVYGVYNSTNYATLKNWTTHVSVIDTLWGGVLMGLTAFFSYKFM